MKGVIMVRITIELREELVREAEQRARQRGLGVADYLRDHLERELDSGNGNGDRAGAGKGSFRIPPLPPADAATLERRKRDPLFTDFETFEDDLPGDVSENLDKYVAEDFEKRKLR